MCSWCCCCDANMSRVALVDVVGKDIMNTTNLMVSRYGSISENKRRRAVPLRFPPFRKAMTIRFPDLGSGPTMIRSLSISCITVSDCGEYRYKDTHHHTAGRCSKRTLLHADNYYHYRSVLARTSTISHFITVTTGSTLKALPNQFQVEIDPPLLHMAYSGLLVRNLAISQKDMKMLLTGSVTNNSSQNG